MGRFKCNNQNPEEMGEYRSALANAAALLRKDRAYIVWGRNLLEFMSREDGTIRHEGPKRGGRWGLANLSPEAVASSQKTGATSQDPVSNPPDFLMKLRFLRLASLPNRWVLAKPARSDRKKGAPHAARL